MKKIAAKHISVKRGKPRIAVWKFSSCDGCQLSLLDCENELLTLTEHIEIAYFPEASSHYGEGPYDVSLVEGSVTTAHDVQRIRDVRRISGKLITIGACATAGGIQSLRNFRDVKDFIQIVYANPEFIDTLETSTAIADHVNVDFELRGCPINKYQLLEVVNALLNARAPNVPVHSVCEECKLKGNICVMVSQGSACLGPVTHAGCGAICPSYNRGCYGCFGPAESTNTKSLGDELLKQGASKAEVARLYSTFNAGAIEFSKAREEYEK